VLPTDEPVGRDSVITVDLQELDKSGLPIVGRAQKAWSSTSAARIWATSSTRG